MTKRAVGIRHEDGTATHTFEAYHHALLKAAELMRAQGYEDSAVVLDDLREMRVREVIGRDRFLYGDSIAHDMGFEGPPQT